MPFAVGEVVAERYEVQAVLGHRPLGWLYRAREREIGVEVALRVIGPEMLSDDAARRGFAQRVGRARAFSHPNLVRVFGVYPTGDEVVVVVQWAPGQTLYERIKEQRFAPEEARPLVMQVAAALSHAHQHGVVLGDVHSGTVVLLGGAVKVSNVAVGPALPRKRFLDAVKATPGYARLPPEMKSGMTPDTRADVYSLAMLVVDMLTGGVDPTAVQGPPAFAAVLARALADDPLLRHGSVDALAHELDALLAGQLPRPRRPTPPVGVPVAREPSGPSRASDKPDRRDTDVARAPALETTRAMDEEELALLKGDQITRQVPKEELFGLRVASSDTQQLDLEMVVDDDEAGSDELHLEPRPAGGERAGDELKTEQVVLLEPDAAKTTEHPRLPPPVNEDEIDTARVTRADVNEIAGQGAAADADENDPNATPLPPPVPAAQLAPPPPASASSASPAPAAATSAAATPSVPAGAASSAPVPSGSSASSGSPSPSLVDAKDVPTKVEVPEPKIEISVELPVELHVQEAPLEPPTPTPPPPATPPADAPLYGDDEDAPTRAEGPALRKLPAPAPPEDDAATREHRSPPPRARRNPFDPVEPPAAAAGPAAAAPAPGRRKPKPRPTLLVPPIGARSSAAGTVVVVALAAFIAAVGVALAISHYLQEQRIAAERRDKQRLADELKARAEALKHAPLDAGLAAAVPAPVVTHPDPAPTVLPRSGPCPLGAHLVSSGGHDFCVDVYEYPGGNTIPRTSVSFEEAARICIARGERLCTQSEWERACRGRGNASYPYGQTYEAARCNTRGPGGEVVATGRFTACKSAVGAYDMSGNVAEWVASGAQKGGSAASGAHESRCSATVRNPPREGSVYVGFRCCADPTAKR